MQKPVLAITLGDPAGIGPEICLKALQNREIQNTLTPLLIGNFKLLQKIASHHRLEKPLRAVSSFEACDFDAAVIHVLDIPAPDFVFQYGQIQASCGDLSYRAIQVGCKLAQEGLVSALVTAPIHKEAIQAAQVPYTDHTEMLAAFTGSKKLYTMFSVQDLRVFFHTKHLSLKEACAYVKKDLLITSIQGSLDCLKALGIASPRLAVAALNPHGGEHGLFGREEMDEIIPAVAAFSSLTDAAVYGPYPADSVFYQALCGKFDGVVSLYHDQGHIATKMVDFHRTISVTFGLPFLRVSVDHGTAFDIAGKGIANATSMEECLRYATRYAPQFQKKADT